MESKMAKRRWARLMVAASLVASVVAATGGTLTAKGNTIEGVWIVQVTQRDCATQAPRGSFSTLVTFVDGGTIYESPGGIAFAPGQRSNAHGTWARLGAGEFRQRMVAQVLFTTPPNLPISPGFEAGWQIVDHTITLSDPDHATSSGTADFYRANGDLYRATCSTAVLERFE